MGLRDDRPWLPGQPWRGRSLRVWGEARRRGQSRWLLGPVPPCGLRGAQIAGSSRGPRAGGNCAAFRGLKGDFGVIIQGERT